MQNNIGEDVLDLRNLWSRYQDLEATLEFGEDEIPLHCEENDEAEIEEYRLLNELFAEVGEPDRDGEFNEPTLILDNYFEEYARELAEEIGAIPEELNWPLNNIDWEDAANELQQDYSSIEVGPYTYWQRDS